jgi:hypothetical protein
MMLFQDGQARAPRGTESNTEQANIIARANRIIA